MKYNFTLPTYIYMYTGIINAVRTKNNELKFPDNIKLNNPVKKLYNSNKQLITTDFMLDK